MFALTANRMIATGALCCMLALLPACAANDGAAHDSVQSTAPSIRQSSSPEKGENQLISPKQAKELMDTQDNVLVLDVRAPEEYAQGHIPNATLIPDYELAERAQNELPDKAQTILVYCRSGRRSAGAAQQLVKMGYENVKDFGGILDWPYDVVTS